MSDSVKVSVFCLAYNHEKYIGKCLEGFAMQKTNFPFEVLVHDDASTDGTAAIIKEYEKKYPDIIKPIYQTENQHSKGVKIIRENLMFKAKGEYFAWCEGDDYWTDCNKLQKQIDFLDSHPEYSVCYHKVLFNNLRDNTTRFVPDIDESRDFSVDEIIRKGAVFQLSSIVIRAQLYRDRPACFTAKGFGDIPIYIHSAICGKCYVMSDVMSVYNHGVAGSWTLRNAKGSKEKKLKHEQDYKALLERINEYYEYKYNDAFSYATDRIQFNIYILSGQKKEARNKKYREFYIRYKKQKRHTFIREKLAFLIKIKKLLKKG